MVKNKEVSRAIFNSFKGLKDAAQNRFENYSSTHPDHYQWNEGFNQPFEKHLRKGLLQQQLDQIAQIQIEDQHKARASQVVQNIFNHFIATFTTEIQASENYEPGMKEAILAKFPEYLNGDVAYNPDAVKFDAALLQRQEENLRAFNQKLAHHAETFKSDINLAVAILFGDQEIMSSGKQMPINPDVFNRWIMGLPASLRPQYEHPVPAPEPAPAALVVGGGAAAADPTADDAAIAERIAREGLAERVGNFQAAGISNEEIFAGVAPDQRALAREILGLAHHQPDALAAIPADDPYAGGAGGAAAAAAHQPAAVAAAARPSPTPRTKKSSLFLNPTEKALLNEAIAKRNQVFDQLKQRQNAGFESAMQFGAGNELSTITPKLRSDVLQAVKRLTAKPHGISSQPLQNTFRSILKKHNYDDALEHLQRFQKSMKSGPGRGGGYHAFRDTLQYLTYYADQHSEYQDTYLASVTNALLEQYPSPTRTKCPDGAAGRAFLLGLSFLEYLNS